MLLKFFLFFQDKLLAFTKKGTAIRGEIGGSRQCGQVVWSAAHAAMVVRSNLTMDTFCVLDKCTTRPFSWLVALLVIEKHQQH